MSTRDELAATLTAQHFDGQGCGGSHAGACSSCYGPSPMSAHEIADVLIAEGWRKKPDASEVAKALSLAMAKNPYTWEEVPTQMCPDDRDGTTKLVKTLHLNPLVDAVLALMDRGQ